MKTKWMRTLLIVLIAVIAALLVIYIYKVFRDISDSNIKITAREDMSAAELYGIMQRNGEFELPYALSDEGAIEYIIFPLDGNNIIKITVEGRVIQVFTAKENWWQNIALRNITNQWSNILDPYESSYQPLLERIAAEIHRISD